MLPRLFKRPHWPIGLELNDRRVRLLQSTGPRSAWRVQALAEQAMPETAASDASAYHRAVAEAVAAALTQGRFAGGELVTTPPTSVVQIKNLRLPTMPAHELAEAVLWEANDRLKIDRNDHEIRYFNAGEIRQGAETRQEVILLAVPRTFIEAHVGAMRQLGLEVISVDAPMAALARVVCEQAPLAPATPDAGATASGTRLIVHVGEQQTQVIIARDRQVVFFKLIEFGLATLREAWRTAGLTVADPTQASEAAQAAGQAAVAEVARELVLCLRYYSVTFRGDRPSQAVLTGLGAMAWLAEALGAQASIGVQPAALLAEDAVAATAPGGPAAWCVACGLALPTRRAQNNSGRAA